MATILKTKLLLTKNGVIKGEFDNYFSILLFFGASIKNGSITFNGKTMIPKYSGEWSDIDAMKDWAKNYMKNNLSDDYKIYRYLI